MKSLLNILNHRLLVTVLHKTSIICSFIYLVLFWSKIAPDTMIFYLILSVVVAIGIAGIGYLLNDYSDRHEDQLAQKINIFNNLSRHIVLFVAVILLLMAIIPWFCFPFNKISLTFLVVEFVLFALYALPPFRLKEKGLIGVITDSLYAQVIPVLFAIYTFYLIANKQAYISIKLLIVLFIWLLLYGIKNILWHQYLDFHNDVKANIKTYTTYKGKSFIFNIVLYLIVIEFFSFLIMLVFLDWIGLAVLLFYLLFIFLYKIKRNDFDYSKFPFRITSSNSTQIITFYAGTLQNEFYERFLPFILIACFIFLDESYISLLMFHLLVFYPIWKKIFER